MLKKVIFPICLLFLLGSFVADASAQRARLELRLTNVNVNPLASAKAKYVSSPNPNRLKFDVEGEDLAPDFTSVDVLLNGIPVALNLPVVNGIFDLELRASDGDSVPTVVLGDIVEVVNPTNGDTMFIGTFSPINSKGNNNKL